MWQEPEGDTRPTGDSGGPPCPPKPALLGSSLEGKANPRDPVKSPPLCPGLASGTAGMLKTQCPKSSISWRCLSQQPLQVTHQDKHEHTCARLWLCLWNVTLCPFTGTSPASATTLHLQLLPGVLLHPQIRLFTVKTNWESEALPRSVTSSPQPLLLPSIPAGLSPGSWAWCPSRCAPQGGTRRCGGRWWVGAGGTAWTGPAVLTARAGCPSPTPRGPPRPPSAHGPVAGSKWQPPPHARASAVTP